MAIRIDGKAIAADIRAELAVRADALKAKGVTPCLAVILAGEDPASKIYVRNKRRACKEIGIESRAVLLPEEVTEEESAREEAAKEEMPKDEELDGKAEVLTMWDYLLMLIILAIPVVNVIVCIIWIVGKNGNPNRRNFAKAWMVLAVVGTLLSGALTFGMVRFMMDPFVKWEQHIEYTLPQEQFIDSR